MARIKIDLPQRFIFTTIIPVRITDINYGGHVGNDTILSILHEARARFFAHFGYTELDLAGVGIIMSDAGIEFKAEVYYGEELVASVAVTGLSNIAFELYYKLEKKMAKGHLVPVVYAKTGMVCYDYTKKKIAPIPEEVRKKFTT
jgi:acyl-CoA thioester hydrolase